MFSQVYEPKGYGFTYVTPDELSTAAPAHVEGARLVWIESPTNPLLNVVDIAAVADAAHAAGALLVVDNTFATPYLQTPLDLGADIVVHSTTKYLGGHSDVVGGFAGTNDPTIAERLAFLQKSLGAVPGPFDAWLVLRGVKTLAVRMERHCDNARRVVAFLSEHPRVERVLWPGLPDHPGHEIAARQMRDFGGMRGTRQPSTLRCRGRRSRRSGSRRARRRRRSPAASARRSARAARTARAPRHPARRCEEGRRRARRRA